MGGYASPAITADYCTDIYDRWNPSLHPLAQMGRNMESGMVLTMSAWHAKETYDTAGGPAVNCDTNAKPPEVCPGGKVCPACGKVRAPCHTPPMNSATYT